MTTGIIDAVRVSFTQSGGAFQLGAATDASVRTAVGIANGTTVYYVAVGIDANGAEVEREVGEGVISSTGTVITPASRSWSTTGAGVGHTFTAPTKQLMLGVTRGMLDAIVPSRGIGDVWEHKEIGCYELVNDPRPTPYLRTVLASGGTIIPVTFDPVLYRASSAWETQAAASGTTTGINIGTGNFDHYRLRGGSMIRSRFAPKTITANTRRIIGWANTAATIGAYFDFNDDDVLGKIDNVVVTSVLGTLAVDTPYVFEIEVNAAATAVAFRLRNGLTDAVIGEQTVVSALSSSRLRMYNYFGVYTTGPGATTAIDWVLDLAHGTRPGYNAWRGSSSP